MHCLKDCTVDKQGWMELVSSGRNSCVSWGWWDTGNKNSLKHGFGFQNRTEGWQNKDLEGG